jgi:NADPH:quinone reductase-like Zn-dependent oxidoreductase
MKRIQYGRYGGPELMRLEEFELAMPGKGEVAVKVKSAAINPIDWKLRNGQQPPASSFVRSSTDD